MIVIVIVIGRLLRVGDAGHERCGTGSCALEELAPVNLVSSGFRHPAPR
jgi:hypothetical protein